MDVVSLLPSATEICFALGVEPVGVSHACDYPPAASSVRSMNHSVVDGSGSSAAVNEAVADAEQEGNGVYAIDRMALAEADPDLVLTQGVCDVCAVDQVLVEEAIADLGLNAEVVTLDPHSLSDVLNCIKRIGAATEREEQATELVADLSNRVRRVQERAAGVDRTPTVAVLDWMDPVMVAGHWVPGMVEIAGGCYELEVAGGRSRPREWSELRDYDPDVLVAAPCGFGLEQTTEHLAELTERPGWNELDAVRNGRAYLMDGHHHVNRPGPRLIETLEHLASLIHPSEFDPPAGDVVRPIGSSEAEPE